jgi:hypothetical protein
MSSGSKATLLRRAEQRIIGLAMAILAFALERIVLRSMRRGSKAEPSGQPRS